MAALVFLTGFAVSSAWAAKPAQSTASTARLNDDEPLFLTPLIEQNSTEALQRSKVDGFAESCGVTGAYSGFITIDDEKNTNLFFLLMKTENETGKPPLILWLQGGPGTSCLFGEFLESGPVGIDRDGHLFRRNTTLQNNFDILYVEQPVGAGFSFTNSSEGYAKSIEDMGKHTELFLQQFLKLFTEYKGRDLYVIGQSYGVRSATAVAVRLHQLAQSENNTVDLRLKGVMLGSGVFTQLLAQMNVTDYLLELKLVNEAGYKTFKDAVEKIKLCYSLRTIHK